MLFQLVSSCDCHLVKISSLKILTDFSNYSSIFVFLQINLNNLLSFSPNISVFCEMCNHLYVAK
jgi:hypothetical protein